MAMETETVREWALVGKVIKLVLVEYIQYDEYRVARPTQRGRGTKRRYANVGQADSFCASVVISIACRVCKCIYLYRA
jgi:hypothetical protein